MNRRDIIKSAVGAAFVAGLSPVEALILPGGSAAIAAASNMLGVNAFDPVGYSSGPVWLNELKHASSNAGYCPWFTGSGSTFDTAEEAYLAATLDSNFNPTTLTVAGIPGGQQFTKLFSYIFTNMPALASGQTYQYTPGARTLGFTILGTGSATSISFTISGDVSGLATTTSGVSIAGNTVTSTLAPGQSGTVTFNATNGLSGFVIGIPAGSGISSNCYFGFTSLIRTSLIASYNAGELLAPEYKAMLQAGWNPAIRFMGAQKTYKQEYQVTFTGTVSGTSGGTLASVNRQGEGNASWPRPTGTHPFVFATGQTIQCGCTYGSTAVTWSTALSSPVTTSAVGAMAIAPVMSGWSARPLLSHMSWSLDGGIPLEAAIAVCNELGMSPWLCMPAATSTLDSTYFSNLAQLIYNGSNANLTGSNQASFSGALKPVYVEFSNEFWNGGSGYKEANYVEMMSVPSGYYASNSNNQYVGGYEWAGAQMSAFCAAATTVMGSTAFNAKVRIAAMTQFAAGNGTSFLEAFLNTPHASNRMYQQGNIVWGFAPYAPSTNVISLADATTIKALVSPAPVTEMLSLMYTNVGASGNTYSSVPSAGLVGNYINTATTLIASFSGQPWYGQPIVGYEGGPALDDAPNLEASLSGWRVDVLNATKDDSRFAYVLYDPTHQLSANAGVWPMLKAAGFEFICKLSAVGVALTHTTPPGGGNFGALQSVMQTLSPLSSAPPDFAGCMEYATA
jgi:hypothetical protein